MRFFTFEKRFKSPLKNEGIANQITFEIKRSEIFSMRGEGGAGEAELWCLL